MANLLIWVTPRKPPVTITVGQVLTLIATVPGVRDRAIVSLIASVNRGEPLGEHLHRETVLVHCTSPEDADRWRADVLRLVPDDVVGDLLTFTWPGRDTTPA